MIHRGFWSPALEFPRTRLHVGNSSCTTLMSGEAFSSLQSLCAVLECLPRDFRIVPMLWHESSHGFRISARNLRGLRPGG